MIEIQRNPVSGVGGLKVVGLGGAGTNAVDDLLKRGGVGFGCLVANTDARALGASVVESRLILGQGLTRGLGAGGDPELGRAAVEESLEPLLRELEGCSLLIVVVGLGGGTGSGGAPRLVEAAKSRGMRTAVLATLPFSFEGRRRMEQAEDSLVQLRSQADLVVCFENDRMSSLVDGNAGIGEAFLRVDEILGQAVRALARVHQRRGLMNTGLDEVGAVLCGSQARAYFGFGRANGEDRMSRALRGALESPLISGCAWNEVGGVWVLCAAGEEVKWREVQSAMEALHGWLPASVRLFVGVSIDESLGGGVEFSVLAGGLGLGGGDAVEAVRNFQALKPVEFSQAVENTLARQSLSLERGEGNQASAPQEPALRVREADHFVEEKEPVYVTETRSGNEMAMEETSSHRESSAFESDPNELRRDVGAALLKRRVAERLQTRVGSGVDVGGGDEVVESSGAPPVEVAQQSPARAEESPLREVARVERLESADREERINVGSGKGRGAVQEQMHFETASRGRFEKTDPTVVDGEDLDVPTFLRQGLAVNREEDGNAR